MANGLVEVVKNAATAGDLTTLRALVATHGGPAVRLEGDPNELTALHWAAASGNVEAVRFLLAPPVGADPQAARNNTAARGRNAGPCSGVRGAAGRGCRSQCSD